MRNDHLKRASALLRYALLTLLMGVSAPMGAQDTTTIFVHGIQSNGSVWDFAVSDLRQRLRITPIQPSIDWTRREPDQAGQLRGILNANPLTSNQAKRMPFVTRSNGGLASREFSRDDARLRQLVTVATPHTGAPLANNWIDYNTLNYANYLGGAVYTPLDFYYAYDPEPPFIIDLAYYFAWPIANLGYALDALMCPLAGLCVVWDGVNYVFAPVVHEMAEGSLALQQLNGGGNLAREAGAIQQRIGLWTALHPSDAVFHLLTAHPDDWSTSRGAATILYWQLYDYYVDHWDWFLAAYAPLWIEGMVALIDMDADWQLLIGTLDWYVRVLDTETGYFFTQMSVYPSDGVVPYFSAEYPGGTRSQQIAGDLAHTRQASSQTVTNVLHDVLRFDFAVPPRESQPPPPSYWVNITGPTNARPGNSCYWYASTSVADANYEWSVDGTVVGSGAELWFSVSGSFTLSIQVWNSQGHGAGNSIFVNVSDENGDCMIQ